MKLCVFDCDSTLIDAETIDELARLNGQNAAVSAITERAMAGKLDFFEALSERVKLLRGVDYQTACEVCHSLPLMPGAEEVVAELKARAYRVIIFSGGFREATVPLAQKLGADADFANFLHHKEGLLTGLVGGEMMAAEAKGTMLERLQRLLGVSAKDTVPSGTVPTIWRCLLAVKHVLPFVLSQYCEKLLRLVWMTKICEECSSIYPNYTRSAGNMHQDDYVMTM